MGIAINRKNKKLESTICFVFWVGRLHMNARSKRGPQSMDLGDQEYLVLSCQKGMVSRLLLLEASVRVLDQKKKSFGQEEN